MQEHRIGWLNGLWSPLGIETCMKMSTASGLGWLNGLWSPLGIETSMGLLLERFPIIG